MSVRSKDRYCDPFNKGSHGRNRKITLQRVTAPMVNEVKCLTTKDYICSACRNQIGKMLVSENTVSLDSDSFNNDDDDGDDDDDVSLFTDDDSCVSLLEKCLSNYNILSFVIVSFYILKLHNFILNEFFQTEERLPESTISLFKKKFHDEKTTKEEKIQILTLMSSSWSICRVTRIMNTSYYLAKKAKQMVKEKGILSIPAKKPGLFFIYNFF